MATFPPRVFGYRPCICDHATHVRRAKKWRFTAKQAVEHGATTPHPLMRAENRAIRDKTLAEKEAKAQKDAKKRKRQRKTSAVTGGVSEVAKRLKTVTFAD